MRWGFPFIFSGIFHFVVIINKALLLCYNKKELEAKMKDWNLDSESYLNGPLKYNIGVSQGYVGENKSLFTVIIIFLT